MAHTGCRDVLDRGDWTLRQVWALVGCTSKTARRKLAKQPIAHQVKRLADPASTLGADIDRFGVTAHMLYRRRLDCDAIAAHVALQRQHADARTNKLQAWFAERGQPLLVSDVAQHPCYDATTGVISDAALVKYYASRRHNLKVMSIDAAKDGTVYIRPIHPYFIMGQETRTTTPCAYFFKLGTKCATLVAPYEADTWPVPQLSSRAPNRPPATKPSTKLVVVSTSVRVLALTNRVQEIFTQAGIFLKNDPLNTRKPNAAKRARKKRRRKVRRQKKKQRSQSAGHPSLPRSTEPIASPEFKLTKKHKPSDRMRRIVPALSELRFRAHAFIEWFLWKHANDAVCQELQLSERNEMRRFFTVVKCAKFTKQTPLGALIQTEYDEFTKMFPASTTVDMIGRLSGASCENVYTDLAKKFITSLEQHSKLLKLKHHFVTSLRPFFQSATNKELNAMLDGEDETKAGDIIVHKIIHLWRRFDQEYKDQTAARTYEAHAKRVAVADTKAAEKPAKRRRVATVVAPPRPPEGVTPWSPNMYLLKVVQYRIKLKALLAERFASELDDHPVHSVKPPRFVPASDQPGAFHRRCGKTRRNKRSVLKSSATKIKHDATPKQFTLVPQCGIERQFIRLDRKTISDWSDAGALFQRLAAHMGVKYCRDPKKPEEPGYHIGSSFTTNGYEIHVTLVLAGFGKAVDEDADADTVSDDEDDDTGAGPCSKLVNNRNAGDFGRLRPSLYCVKDLRDGGASLSPEEEAAAVGVDPGGVFVLTGTNGFRVSKSHFYAQTGKKNHPQCTDSLYNNRHKWKARKKYGYVPAYIRACHAGLLSRKPFTLTQYALALRQLNDALPSILPHVVGDPNRLVRHPEECGTRQDAMWRFVLGGAQMTRRFRGFQRSQRFLDKVVQELAPSQAQVVVVGNGYDGSQHQGLRSGLSAPFKKVIRHVGRKRRVVFSSEYRSTATCNRCGHHGVESVFHWASGQSAAKEVHGVKYCPSCKHRLNRDQNAAANILSSCLATLCGKAVTPVGMRWNPGECSFLKSSPWC